MADTESTQAKQPAEKHPRRAIVVVLLLLFSAATVIGAAALVRTFQLAGRFLEKGGGSFKIDAHSRWAVADRILALDLAACAAAVVLFFFALLTVFCVKVLLKGRGALPVFPAKFAQFCVQLGLLGALIAFAMIAWDLGRVQSTSAAAGGATTQTTMPAQVAKVREAAGTRQAQRGTATDSAHIFLMLCASLYSTLVGCFCAYVMIPAARRVVPGLMGMGWSADDKAGAPEEAEGEYVRRLREASAAMESVGSAGTAIDNLGTRVESLDRKLEQVQTSFDMSTRSLADAAGKMSSLGTSATKLSDAATGMSGVATLINAAANNYQRQTEQMEKRLNALAKPVEGMVTRMESALNNFSGVTADLKKEFLGPLARLAATIGDAMGGIAGTLGSLVKARQNDQALLEKMHSELSECGKRIDSAEQTVRATSEQFARESQAQQAQAKTQQESAQKQIESLSTEVTRLSGIVAALQRDGKALRAALEQAGQQPPRRRGLFAWFGLGNHNGNGG